MHYNAGNSYLFFNGKEIFNFKTCNKKVNFPTQFVLEVYLMDLVLMSLEKYLQMEMRMIFQSITILLVTKNNTK